MLNLGQHVPDKAGKISLVQDSNGRLISWHLQTTPDTAKNHGNIKVSL